MQTVAIVVCVVLIVAIAVLARSRTPRVTVYPECDFLGRPQALDSGTHNLIFGIRSLEVPRGCAVSVDKAVDIRQEDVLPGQSVKRRCLPEAGGEAVVHCTASTNLWAIQ